VFGFNPGLRLRGQTCPVLGSNMFGNCLWNLIIGSDKSDKRLSRCDERVDRTCPIQETDIFDKSYRNSAMDPNKSGGLRKLEWSGHVRFYLLEFGLETVYIRIFGKLDCKIFFNDLHFTNSPNASSLIVRSSYDTKNIKKLPNP
jgi:hypothetical protein